MSYLLHCYRLNREYAIENSAKKCLLIALDYAQSYSYFQLRLACSSTFYFFIAKNTKNCNFIFYLSIITRNYITIEIPSYWYLLLVSIVLSVAKDVLKIPRLLELI